MTAQQTVTIKVEADTADALRKLRQVGREARRTRRQFRGGWWGVVQIILTALSVGNGVVGIITHSAYLVALACLLWLMASTP